jgi:hypothetical protein
LQHQCRRGHGETEADDQRGLPRQLKAEVRRGTYPGRGEQHLRRSQAEDGFAHYPKARGLEFQADDEHQEYDAKLRNMLGGINFADQA